MVINCSGKNVFSDIPMYALWSLTAVAKMHSFIPALLYNFRRYSNVSC